MSGTVLLVDMNQLSTIEILKLLKLPCSHRCLPPLILRKFPKSHSAIIALGQHDWCGDGDEMTQQRYAPGLFDRLIDDRGTSAPAAWTLEQLKDAVARDLESLLNTRAAIPEALFAAYPEASKSVLTYGLVDFAGMCMTSDTDRKRICAAVLLTIERHESRLYAVTASLRIRSNQINRFDFVISGKLKAQAASDVLHFDAVLEPATQRYSIRKA